MKRQKVQRSIDDMLNAFQYKLYQMKAASSTKLPEDIDEIEAPQDVEASDDGEYHGWRALRSKQVQDSDGFWTDYTLYELEDGGYGCVFGDNDVYNPDTSWLDAQFDTKEEALNWFENYSTDEAYD